MDKRFFTNLSDAVKKAAQSQDMTELEQNLNQAANEVAHSVKDAVNQVSTGLNRSAKEFRKNWNYAAPSPPQRTTAPPPIVRAPKRRRPARGNALGTTLTAIGSTLIPLSSIALVFGGIHFLVRAAFSSLGTLAAVTLPILGTSILFAKADSKLRARYRRCETYLRLTGDADFITVKQLASGTQQSPDYVANDLNRMIRKKMLPDAHMDQQKTCLMLGSDTYQQYLDAQKALEERQAEEERIRRECEEDPRRAELYRTVEEGKAYIRQIKEANDALPDEDISNKLFRLEDVTTRIFDHVEKHPEKLSEIGKFMRYYLPTTLKLVNAYREFEQQPAQGENIRSAKEEIKKSLDVINQAFEKLLDSLFEDDALDISTDISVLQTMLAQEGLTGSDFSQEDRKS